MLPPAPPAPRDGALRVALADDSYLIREAVARVLAVPGIDIVASCADGDRLLEAVDSERPDVVVTDVRMPPTGDQEGIRVARELRRRHPAIGVVLLSLYAEPQLGAQLLADGAAGRAYLLKERVHSRAQVLAALQVVADGGSMFDPTLVGMLLDRRRASRLDALTARELEVLREMAEGKSNAAIADALVLSKRAVEKHVGNVFFKLDLPDERAASRRVSAVLVYLLERQA